MSITFKLGTLAIRTLAKPISVTLKSQAKQHAAFRRVCINVAQTMHRLDINMRMNLLGEKGLQHVRPLNEAKAIDSGANFISETFLFSVAGGLIVFESWRSRRKEQNRREGVADAIEALQKEVEDLRQEMQRRSQHRIRPPISLKPPITDRMALQILHPNLSAEIIKKTASEIRTGLRSTDY